MHPRISVATALHICLEEHGQWTLQLAVTSSRRTAAHWSSIAAGARALCTLFQKRDARSFVGVCAANSGWGAAGNDSGGGGGLADGIALIAVSEAACERGERGGSCRRPRPLALPRELLPPLTRPPFGVLAAALHPRDEGEAAGGVAGGVRVVGGVAPAEEGACAFCVRGLLRGLVPAKGEGGRSARGRAFGVLVAP
jgi:hypothetical protein